MEAGPFKRKSSSKNRPSDVWEDMDDHDQIPEKQLSISSGESSSPRRVIRSPRSTKTRTPIKRSFPLPARTPTKSQSNVPPSPKKPPERPHPQPATLLDTLNVILIPFRLIFLPLSILLSPLYAHLANGILLLTLGSLTAYFLLPLIPSLVLRLLGKALRSISGSLVLRTLSYARESDVMLGKEVLLLPAKTLATPACLLTGLFCQTSLLAHNGDNGTIIPAKPFWARSNDLEDDLDVGQIWELAVAVNTGSTLDGKGFIAEQLRELGDMTRDLSDEIVHIDSKTVNAFSWLQWEFKDLVKLLSRPPSSRPSSSIISSKLHSLLLRLSNELDSIYTLTSTAAQQASRASEQGQGLYTELNRKATGLQYERDRSPGWKRVYDKSAHFLVGGEPSKAELVDRDLRITTKTIGNIRALSRNLEETRTKVKVYRDQIGMFGASMMGFHLGSSEDVGLGPEEEVRVLNEVVEGLARSVGMAKQEGRSGRKEPEVLEIDQ
uniref:Uncharacterized protein n=1 Tax=Kwoniella dejecticola CBS 10117 TaxID=1296121 RepID=A0A1A6ADU7_9TREE|nr:uncharacterized protein I303_00053 [Kwoniella dejecticola CBS 10117]OBR88242.1 hypothetical protein I303_00053 [Kwoniella dejecticola CBS 10117]